jgi:Dockerin type I domain
VTWQGRPAQPNALQQLPITLTLKLGATEVNYPVTTTDASGFFVVAVGGLPNGTYDWRVKGPLYLANAGTVPLTGALTTSAEMGLLRAGDCNNDNLVSAPDFIILKNTFGKASGDPGYDDRADFTGDQVVNAPDFSLMRSNFGLGGPPPIIPTAR